MCHIFMKQKSKFVFLNKAVPKEKNQRSGELFLLRFCFIFVEKSIHTSQSG